MTDYCPPHYFIAAWRTESEGVIYCRMCGDIREMVQPTIGPIDDATLIRQEDEAARRRGSRDQRD